MSDDYEREYMPGKGAVLHRHKVHAPWWAVALAIGLPFAGLGTVSIGLALAGAPAVAALGPFLGGVAYVGLMSALFAVFAGGRIAVSEGELHLQIGPAGPRVAMEDIESCTLAPSGLRSYSLGARKLLDGTTVFSMLGDNARSVHVRRRDGSRIILVCREPEAVVKAIEEARARLASAVPRTRVELSEEEAQPETESKRDQRRADR